MRGDRAGMGGKYFGDYYENWGKRSQGDKRRHAKKLRRNASKDIKERTS